MPEDDDLHPLVPNDDTNGLDSVAVEMPEPPALPIDNVLLLKYGQLLSQMWSGISPDVTPFELLKKWTRHTCLVQEPELDLTVTHHGVVMSRGHP